jgi:hypothetical protein
LQQRHPPTRCPPWATAEETTASHDIFGTPFIRLHLNKSVCFSFIGYTAYRLQPPYFSPPTEQEGDHYQGLESLFVDRPPGLLTSPPGDQNYSINPVIAPPVVPFHTTTLYTNGSGGNYVDQIEYPAPHCALSHRTPPQVPLSNDYTQAYSTTNSFLSYDPRELHNMQAYHDPSRQYYTQVQCRFISDPHRTVYGSHWLSSRWSKDSPVIT